MSSSAIDEIAIDWVTRGDRGALSSDEATTLQNWLDADSRHRGAYLRAQAMWRSMDRLGDVPIKDATAAPQAALWSRRGVIAAGGSAVAAAALAIVGSEYWSKGLRITTPVGEVLRTPLKDGSVVTVNTNSEMMVHLTDDLRQLTLVKGEVLFDVAKDAARPFVVRAGNVVVRAVGTSFSVRRRDSGADVLVTEGVVETWLEDQSAHRKHVAAGARVFVSNVSGPSTVIETPQQIDNALAWRSGEIVLDGQTLVEAAEEFNRYNDRKITIDPALSNKRVVGWFHINEPDTFAAAAAMTVKGQVVAANNEIHISPAAQL